MCNRHYLTHVVWQDAIKEVNEQLEAARARGAPEDCLRARSCGFLCLSTMHFVLPARSWMRMLGMMMMALIPMSPTTRLSPQQRMQKAWRSPRRPIRLPPKSGPQLQAQLLVTLSRFVFPAFQFLPGSNSMSVFSSSRHAKPGGVPSREVGACPKEIGAVRALRCRLLS